MAWVFALAALIAAGRVHLLSASHAVFLSRHPAEAYGWTYLLAGGMLALTGVATRVAQARLPFALFTGALLAVAACGGVGFWALLGPAVSSEIALVLPAWLMVVWVWGLLVLWSTASRLLDGEQAGRLFGLMGCGEVAGDLLGGATVGPLLRWVPTTDLLLTSAGLLLLAGGMASAIAARFRLADEPTTDLAPVPQPLNRLVGPYVRRIVLLSGLVTLGYYFVDLGFYRQVAARFDDSAQVAGFVGGLYGAISLLTLVMRGVASGRVLGRYGPAALHGLPLAVVGVMLAVAASELAGHRDATFALVVISVVVWRVLRDGLDKPGSLLLYQALPPRPRLATQSLVETVTDGLATALAGGLLLLLARTPGFGTAPLALSTAVLAGSWVWIARRLAQLQPLVAASYAAVPVSATLDPPRGVGSPPGLGVG